jgi:ribosomal protein S18 acetylase RimI-like enzyme
MYQMNEFLQSLDLQVSALSRFGIGIASDWLALPANSEINLFRDWAEVRTASFESYQFGNAVFLDRVALHKSDRLGVVERCLAEINPELLIVESENEEQIDIPDGISVAVDAVLSRTEPSRPRRCRHGIWNKEQCLENWDALLSFYETRDGESDFFRCRFSLYRERLLGENPKNNCTWIAAIQGGTILGAVGVFWGEAYGSVQELYVDPENRRTGVGQEMIEYAIQNRPCHGPLVAVADRDDGAESFYRKIGFQFRGTQQWVSRKGNR